MVDQLSLPDLPGWVPLDPVTASQQFAESLRGRRQAERWKYTPLNKVWSPTENPEAAANADGNAHNREINTLPGSTEWWSMRLEQVPDALHRLCQANHPEVIKVAANSNQTIDLSQDTATAPTLILVGANATLELNDSLSTGNCQDDVWLWLDANAQVVHSRNNLADGASHLYRFLSVHVGTNAQYRLHNHSKGAGLHRQDTYVDGAGVQARIHLDMANWVDEEQHLDQHTVVTHAAPDSHSEQRVHTIAGHKAKVTFNGRIHIQADSPEVSAHLNNRNLALSDVATINTKPELEIYTDDVACSHGATVGMLDADHLFYFASRGVETEAARMLLAQGFLRSIIDGPLSEAAEAALLNHEASEGVA